MNLKNSNATIALMNLSHVMGDIAVKKFPDYQMSWPCMTGYNGTAYEHDKGVVLLLRNNPKNSMASVGLAQESLSFKHMPQMEMTYENVNQVANNLNSELQLTAYDIAVNVYKDIALWNGDFKELDNNICTHVIHQIESRVDKMYDLLPKRNIVNNKIVTTIGDNNKVLVDSVDNSINVTINGDIYDELLNCLDAIPNKNERDQIEVAIKEMQSHHGSPSYLQKYQDFMGKVANHVTVFGSLLGSLGVSLASAMGS